MSRLSFDQAVTPLLLRRFELEAEMDGGDGRYYACILREDGHLLVHSNPVDGVMLDTMQLLWAAKLLRLINREIHHDGAWVVVFTHPKPAAFDSAIHAEPKATTYARYCIIWLDKDGDPQFTQEWIENDNADFRWFSDVVLAGVESTAQKCEGSWQVWHEMMVKLIQPKEGQTFKRAKGERPASTRT